MKKAFTALAAVSIRAKDEKVWNALVDPEVIKQYLFGTEVSTDWKPGSPIVYRGVWEGKPYVDKGTVVDVVPRRLLKTTYWSAFSGLPDAPENYSTVTYKLEEKGEVTILSVTQENNTSQASADHSAANWNNVLKKLKDLLEKQENG